MAGVRWQAGLIGFAVLCVLLTGCRQDTDASKAAAITAAATTQNANVAFGTETPTAKKPLNVLLITMDTTRADALGVYGQPLPVTPNIDRLAREGALFRDAVSAAPITLPSHASIMTAVYPFVHGVRSNDGYVLPQQSVTLAEILRQHGYRTAAEISAMVLNHQTGMDQGFESYRDLESPDIDTKAAPSTQRKEKDDLALRERYASDITRHAIAFLATRHDGPFFLWLHYFSPHAPYVPPQDIWKEIPDDPYLGEVRYVDHEIGVVLKAMDRIGLTENTLIVVTSDHGESRGEHNEATHSFLVYDSTMHVPLIFKGPMGIVSGLEINGVVRLIDIAPTILDLLDYEPMQGIQGVSLGSLLSGESTDPGLVAYGESIGASVNFGSSVLRFVRKGDWKYIHSIDRKLFDLEADPEELHNLAAEWPERVDELYSTLREQLVASPTPIRSKRIPLPPGEADQLAALGYATSTMPPKADTRLEGLELCGPDPDVVSPDMDLYLDAIEYRRRNDFERSFDILKGLFGRYPNSMPFAQAYLISSLELKRYDVVLEIVDAMHRKGDSLDEFWPHFSDGLVKELKLGDDGATTVLERLLASDPCDLVIRAKLAESYRLHRAYQKQKGLLEAGLVQCGPSFEIMNDLSYMLSTCPVASMRNGDRALELAQRALKLAGHDEPGLLDTVAAAYAEIGDFSQATLTARKALALLDTHDPSPERRAVYQTHLEFLERGEPIREE